MDVVTPKLNLGGQLGILVRWRSVRVFGLPSSFSATGALLSAYTLGLAAQRFTFLLLTLSAGVETVVGTHLSQTKVVTAQVVELGVHLVYLGVHSLALKLNVRVVVNGQKPLLAWRSLSWWPEKRPQQASHACATPEMNGYVKVRTFHIQTEHEILGLEDPRRSFGA